MIRPTIKRDFGCSSGGVILKTFPSMSDLYLMAYHSALAGEISPFMKSANSL